MSRLPFESIPTDSESSKIIKTPISNRNKQLYPSSIEAKISLSNPWSQKPS